MTAHVDDRAAATARELGANGYTVGRAIAFADPAPDMWLAAHEAAHAVHQRAGVGGSAASLEQQADEVAALAAGGGSAELVLDRQLAGASGKAQPRLQRDLADEQLPALGNLEASAQLVDFDRSEIGMSTESRVVTITNTGETAVGEVAIEMVGPDADQFVAFTDQNASLAPGDSVELNVFFTPFDFGNRSCLIRLFSRDPEAETFVMVRGIGYSDWWRRAIKHYHSVVAQTGHGYSYGDPSFYRFLAKGNYEPGHNEPGITKEQADLIENNFGFKSPPTDEELAQRAKDAANFVPPPPLYIDSQGHIGTAEELRARYLLQDIEAIDNLTSIGGTVGYGVSGIWTDDPHERMAWAGLGNTIGGITGSVASAYGNRPRSSEPSPSYRTYDSGKSNQLVVGPRGSIPPPGPAPAITPLPETVVSGTVRTTREAPIDDAPIASVVSSPVVTEPQSQKLLPAGNPGIGGRLSNQSLDEIGRRYGQGVSAQTAQARTQQDLDTIGRSLGGKRDEYLATVTELASRDLRTYAGQLVTRPRGTGTTPGTDLFGVNASGTPEITGVEVKIGASASPYRQGASSMPNAYRVEETLHAEIWNVIRDRNQPIQIRARMKMALDAGTPIKWELDAYGNVRFKLRGNDIFPADVLVVVPIEVPR